jgi:tetratricopeptide (TPR) repeat protein
MAAPTIERLIDQGRLPEARAKLREQFAKEGERPRLLLFEAMILYREQQYLDSIRKLDRVLNLDDADPDVYKLAGLNLVSVGKADLAAQYFEKAVELAPSDFMAHYYLCLYRLTDGQRVAAETSCRATTQLNPKYLDGYLALGVALEQSRMTQEAIQTYLQACGLAEEQGSQTATPYLYLARLLISSQQFEQSLPPLRKAEAVNPKSPEVRTALGQALSRLGRYEQAVQSLQEAVTLAPNEKTPHYLLIGIYQKLGMTEQARREMRIFRALEEKENQK